MKTFEPQTKEFESRVRRSFARQRLMTTIGAEIVHVAPGEVSIELPFRDDLTQQNGYIHAGMVASIADSACGYAAYTLMPGDVGVLSIEYKINLLSPALGDKLIARATVKRAGRNITTCVADVFALKGYEEKLVATMLATMMTIKQ